MLKYLFAAKFKDGKILQQQSDDISSIDPLKSSFYDVLKEEERGNQLELFCLADGVNDYLVDLNDGHFEVNGVKFNAHNSENFFSNRRLIYFRRNTLNFTQGLEPLHHGIIFKLGWQALDIHGNNVQYVIELE